MSGTCVKERPILFSGEMVRALLDGRKTQTRRIVKVQPIKIERHEVFQRAGTFAMHFFGEIRQVACPYGKVGERLWIKTGYRTRYDEPRNQTYWSIDSCFATTHGKPLSKSGAVKRDGNHPGMFMPRWLSPDLKLPLLEITDVRVERLNDITFADCREEGCDASYSEQVTPCKVCDGNDPCDGRHVGEKWQFSRLWESINGPGSWEQNPWVWAITFKRVDEARR